MGQTLPAVIPNETAQEYKKRLLEWKVEYNIDSPIKAFLGIKLNKK